MGLAKELVTKHAPFHIVNFRSEEERVMKPSEPMDRRLTGCRICVMLGIALVGIFMAGLLANQFNWTALVAVAVGTLILDGLIIYTAPKTLMFADACADETTAKELQRRKAEAERAPADEVNQYYWHHPH